MLVMYGCSNDMTSLVVEQHCVVSNSNIAAAYLFTSNACPYYNLTMSKN